jgi:hypothetical protein
MRDNGIRLSGSDDDVRAMNHWFIRHVEASAQRPNRLAPLWYAVVNDVTLYLGDQLVARTKVLRWAFEVSEGCDTAPVPIIGRGRVATEHPGLCIAFPVGKDREYHMRLDDLVADYALAVLADRHVDADYFLNILLAAVYAV